jgi:hypothetical protein
VKQVFISSLFALLLFAPAQEIYRAGGGSGPHNLLSATHPDTVAGTPASGDILCHDGTSWVRVPKGPIGTFLRINTTLSPPCEWTTGPNINNQNADVSNSSNVNFTLLTDMTAAPAADTWVTYTCDIWYKSAATTTGITIGLYVNDAALGGTAPPQFFAAKYDVSGNTAAGTAELWGATSNTEGTAGAVTSNQTNTTTLWYNLKITANILTHATVGTIIFPIYRSEVNLSAVEIKENSSCTALVNHVDS